VLLSIRDLEVRFPHRDRDVVAVAGVDLEIMPGEVFGMIGETGAGKSLTAWAAIDLVPSPGHVSAGEVRFDDLLVTGADEQTLRKLRGGKISIIVQNPHGALNPVKTVGAQIANVYRAHNRASRADARNLVRESLRRVGIADAERRARAYPHQLSGGMAQRVMIAMALANRPRLVIADEPTTGLDVTIQAEILDLMAELVNEAGSAVWIITHDLGIIATYTERAGVMFAGQVVELAPTRELFARPLHPYTPGLIEWEAVEGSDAARRRLQIGGAPPDLAHRPPGCQFAYRCPWAEPQCRAEMPMLREVSRSHHVRCFVAQRDALRARETQPVPTIEDAQ
jgi:oligopeptide/dipeptide ABC transporter ATP-binding protein